MHLSTSLMAATFLVFAGSKLASSSIWVTSVPSFVRPYAIARYVANGYVVQSQIYRFPVTGVSSANTFTLIRSAYLGVLPHVHQAHYENFFDHKGRFQLWTENGGNEQARLLTAGDYGAVPQNTTHTFQSFDPDAEMVGIIQPNGSEHLFYVIVSTNYSSNKYSPYDPSVADFNSSPPASLISSLQAFDVYAKLGFGLRRDLVNGTAPAGTAWHAGLNALATYTTTPYFISKDYGPQYLSNSQEYQIIQPLVTPTQSGGNFTLRTITMDTLLDENVAANRAFAGHVAFEALEGVLSLEILGETVYLGHGDVVFIPRKTTYKYWSRVAFTKVLRISQGGKGMDTALIAAGMSRNSPVWPTQT